MPCYLCAGAVVQFGIKKVIAGESETFSGAKKFLESHRVEVIDLNLDECIQLMKKFSEAKPELWKEDIGKL
jgi:cytosine deaminase